MYGAGVCAKALRLPVLVGFLAVGLVLAGFGITATDTLITIGDFGVIFLLFTVGLHSRVKNILQPDGGGVIHLGVSIALYTGVLFALSVASSAGNSLIPEPLVVVLGLLAAIFYALNTPLSNAANDLWTRYERWLGRFERQQIEHPDEQLHTLGGTDILIVGMGSVGTAAYDYLIEHGNRP
ncbi:MAG: cation:proton antiporter [Chloroflexota bacterium]